jgi:hypothetical protein
MFFNFGSSMMGSFDCEIVYEIESIFTFISDERNIYVFLEQGNKYLEAGLIKF